MLEISNFGIFFGTALIILITPGPAILYIVTRSIDQGLIAGIISNIGLCVGNLFQFFGIIIGLSTLYFSSSFIFNILKYFGGFYLIYLGLYKIFKKENYSQVQNNKNMELMKIFVQSIILNIFNPKSAIFFIAFLPQFVIYSIDNITFQFLILGLIYLVLSIFIGLLYSIIGNILGYRLKMYNKFLNIQSYIIGCLLISIGFIITIFVNI